MTQDIIYSLKTNPSGTRIVWKDDNVGVRVLFHKDGKTLIASAVTFDADKFTSETANRWLASRISQYALNSQISTLTPYEDALLASLVAYKTEYAELASRYINTPAISNLQLGTNCLLDWKEFVGEKTRPVASDNKPKSIVDVGILNQNNDAWKASRQIEERLKASPEMSFGIKKVKPPKELQPVIDNLVANGFEFISSVQNVDRIEILLSKGVYQLRLTQNPEGNVSISYYKQMQGESYYVDNIPIDDLPSKLQKVVSKKEDMGLLNGQNALWNKTKLAKVGSIDA